MWRHDTARMSALLHIRTMHKFTTFEQHIHTAVETHFGSVARIVPRHGGHASSLTCSIQLESGAKFFLKGIDDTASAFMRSAFEREVRAYRDLSTRIAPWAPRFIGTFEVDALRLIAMEDLGLDDGRPWSSEEVRIAGAGLAAFHNFNKAERFPTWVTDTEWQELQRMSDTVTSDMRGLREKSPSVSHRETSEWLFAEWWTSNLPTLRRALLAPHASATTRTLLHLDLRPDNCRAVGERFRMFDWAGPGVGPREVDVGVLGQALAAEYAIDPREFEREYRAHAPIDDDILSAVVVSLLAFFSHGVWFATNPCPDGVLVRRLRQLRACAEWATLRLGLKPPAWVSTIDAAGLCTAEGAVAT
jgi:fructosamine-3-kinase